MNIYQKLTAARLKLMQSGAKKSGHNSFANFDYFELSDILPIINQLAQELGFLCKVSFGIDEASLEVINTEKPDERIAFASPMAAAELRNNHPVQNLGAAQTYLRRYLYMAAFEITECDMLDATAGKSEAKTQVGRKDTASTFKKKDYKAEEIKRILEESRYPSGSLVFAPEDIEMYRKRYKEARDKGEVLSDIEKELAKRMKEWEELKAKHDV